MTFESDIEKLDRDITDNTKLVKLAKALERLQTNPDFITVIKDGYFREEAVRLVHLKADPGMQAPEHQARIIRSMDSIGNLVDYLSVIRNGGEQAIKAIVDAEEQRAEILEGDE